MVNEEVLTNKPIEGLSRGLYMAALKVEALFHLIQCSLASSMDAVSAQLLT